MLFPFCSEQIRMLKVLLIVVVLYAAIQITLGTVLHAPNRVVECRLKSPEKGKARVLAEQIDAEMVSSCLRE
jgi:hypothetical protein